MEKKLFFIGLLLSFLLHGVAMVSLSLLHSRTILLSKPLKSIELTYQALKTETKKEEETPFKDLKVTRNLKSYQNQKVKVLTKKENIFSTIGARIRDISKLSGKLKSSQTTQKITTLDVGKKITISPLKAEKITNPKYLTYNDDMRETISRNIKQRAYTYVNHPNFEAGEVYLTFVLESGGMLKQVKVIEDKTFANGYLRDVALRSIKESNPFPPFPKGFDYPEFTFNLLISFQN